MKTILTLPLLCASLAAQTLDPAILNKPLSGDWPTYSGDYSGQRYSKLGDMNIFCCGHFKHSPFHFFADHVFAKRRDKMFGPAGNDYTVRVGRNKFHCITNIVSP